MFEYLKDVGCKWPEGRSLRSITDHIQIHHTVGDYTTPARFLALHNARVADPNYRGIEYSFGVAPNGDVFDGRGLLYKHGAVKNSLTKNAAGIGAADRSVSIALLGDMRNEGMPTDAQMLTALRLAYDCMTYFNLSFAAVLGHNEIPLYSGGKPTGKLYPTLCPVIDMNEFRGRIIDMMGRNLSLTKPLMRGDDVREFQERLISMGYDLGVWGADGIYGAATEGAQRLLCERAAQLTPGVVDAAMRAMLGL
jgi:hypothetical protein